MNIRRFFLAIALSGLVGGIHAQELSDSTHLIEPGVIYMEPLFEYPVAPEELTDFRAKCDWLAENFWSQLDVKSKVPVDQNKLNHAFMVYATTCQYASKEKVSAAVDKLLKSVQKNPTLLLQLTKAAEENIYGPRAEVWIDELYVKFLRAAVANKKFPKARKERYLLQLKQLEKSMVGVQPPEFDFTRANGDPARYFPMSTPTILIFGDPDCSDCRLGTLRMESNVAFGKAVTDGKINVLFIIPDAEEEWQKKMEGFPKGWTLGASDTVGDLFDMRNIPEIYLIGKDGKIVDKHINHIQAMQQALGLINDKN